MRMLNSCRLCEIGTTQATIYGGNTTLLTSIVSSNRGRCLLGAKEDVCVTGTSVKSVLLFHAVCLINRQTMHFADNVPKGKN
jgi:hypothetical protein